MFFWAEEARKVNEIWTGLLAIVPGGVLVLVAIQLFQKSEKVSQAAFVAALEKQTVLYLDAQRNQRDAYLAAQESQRTEHTQAMNVVREDFTGTLKEVISKCPWHQLDKKGG
jgi:hypothetical protein